jgi:hypothetical protein
MFSIIMCSCTLLLDAGSFSFYESCGVMKMIRLNQNISKCRCFPELYKIKDMMEEGITFLKRTDIELISREKCDILTYSPSKHKVKLVLAFHPISAKSK